MIRIDSCRQLSSNFQRCDRLVERRLIFEFRIKQAFFEELKLPYYPCRNFNGNPTVNFK